LHYNAGIQVFLYQFLGNNIQDQNIIKLIEEAAKTENELEKELNIFDICKQQGK
jgi:hypothetical protein